MSDFLDNSDKTCNFKFYWAIIFFSRSEEPREKKNRLTPIKKIFVNYYIKYYFSKAKLLGYIQVYS